MALNEKGYEKLVMLSQ